MKRLSRGMTWEIGQRISRRKCCESTRLGRVSAGGSAAPSPHAVPSPCSGEPARPRPWPPPSLLPSWKPAPCRLVNTEKPSYPLGSAPSVTVLVHPRRKFSVTLRPPCPGWEGPRGRQPQCRRRAVMPVLPVAESWAHAPASQCGSLTVLPDEATSRHTARGPPACSARAAREERPPAPVRRGFFQAGGWAGPLGSLRPEPP